MFQFHCLWRVVLLTACMVSHSAVAVAEDERDTDWLKFSSLPPQILIPMAPLRPRQAYLTDMIESLRFSPDGKHVVTVDRTGKLFYWSIEDHQLAKSVPYPVDAKPFPQRNSRITTVYSTDNLICLLSPSCQYLLREVFCDRLILINVATGKQTELPLGKDWQKADKINAHFSPDEASLLVELVPHDIFHGPYAKMTWVRMWDTATGQLRWETTLRHPTVAHRSNVAFRADNKTVQINQQTRDIKTGERQADVPVPQDHYQWTVSSDRESVLRQDLKEISLADGKLLHQATLDDQGGTRAMLTLRSAPFAADRHSAFFSLWTFQTGDPYRLGWCEWPSGKLRALLSYPKATTIQHVTLSPDGRWLAAVAPDQALILLWKTHDLPQPAKEKRPEKAWRDDWQALASLSGVRSWQAMHRMLAEPLVCVRVLKQKLEDRHANQAKLNEGEQLQLRRAVELLCILRSDEARQLLKDWSVSGQPEELRTLSKQGLSRLDKQQPTLVLVPVK